MPLAAYALLGVAILAEVIGTSALSAEARQGEATASGMIY